MCSWAVWDDVDVTIAGPHQIIISAVIIFTWTRVQQWGNHPALILKYEASTHTLSLSLYLTACAKSWWKQWRRVINPETERRASWSWAQQAAETIIIWINIEENILSSWSVGGEVGCSSDKQEHNATANYKIKESNTSNKVETVRMQVMGILTTLSFSSFPHLK